MQPTTLNKPVMDVAAPKSPAMPPNPFAQSGAVTPRPVPAASSALPVRPAPLATPSPVSTNSPTPDQSAKPAADSRPATKKSAQSGVPTSHAPVALITVTVFVMLVLSALAVTVYMTSQTA